MVGKSVAHEISLAPPMFHIVWRVSNTIGDSFLLAVWQPNFAAAPTEACQLT